MKSNIDILKDYVGGVRPFTQIGYTGKQYTKHIVGDKWIDSKGQQWEQKESGPVTVSRVGNIIREALNQKCKCGQIIRWGTKYDELFFRKTGLCYDCLIDYETKLRILNIYPDYEKYKIMSNEIGHLKDGLVKLKELIKYFTENEGNIEMLCNSEGFIERWKNTNRDQILKDAKADLKRGRQQIDLLSKEKEAAKKRYLEASKKYNLDVFYVR